MPASARYPADGARLAAAAPPPAATTASACRSRLSFRRPVPPILRPTAAPATASEHLRRWSWPTTSPADIRQASRYIDEFAGRPRLYPEHRPATIASRERRELRRPVPHAPARRAATPAEEQRASRHGPLPAAILLNDDDLQRATGGGPATFGTRRRRLVAEVGDVGGAARCWPGRRLEQGHLRRWPSSG